MAYCSLFLEMTVYSLTSFLQVAHHSDSSLISHASYQDASTDHIRGIPHSLSEGNQMSNTANQHSTTKQHSYNRTFDQPGLNRRTSTENRHGQI